MMAAAIRHCATPANRLIMRRIGSVSRLLAATPSRSRHRGTFKEDMEYAAYDAVALNGGSFLALRDKPGRMSWPRMAIARCAGQARRRRREPQGDRGPAGIAGPPGKDAATIVGWAMDRSAYTVTPIMSDGSSGPPLNLRGLFEQFVHETDSR